MELTSEDTGTRSSLRPAAAAIVIGVLLLVFTVHPAVGCLAAGLAVALFAYRAHMWWLAACCAVWTMVFLAVLVFPGPYDSWAGRTVIPVLAGYTTCFLGGWALARRWVDRRSAPTVRQRPALVWPSEFRLRAYLLVLLVVGVVAAVMRYGGELPPLFADNPDVARDLIRQRTNIVEGLLSEAWTLGMSISLLRALTGTRRGRMLYFTLALVFTFGAALGASKNSVLMGIVPALIAALSVNRGQRAAPLVKTRVVVLIGLVAVGAAVFLGGQRTLAGTGTFEDEFRARYGNNAVAASIASMDLSLTSSTETFGRLWAQRELFEPRHGAYSLTFLGSRAEPLLGKTDLYGITAQLSKPYYMNTATFVAIPLMDYGAVGAALFLLLLGLCVGLVDRGLEFSAGPAQHLGRSLVVYYAAFGIYELYPVIQPIWLSLIPGLAVLYLIGRRAR